MQLPTPGFLFTAFLSVCRRFPAAMLCSCLATAACFILIDSTGSGQDADFIVRFWLTCQLGLPFLTALVAYSESKDWEEKRSWALQIFGLVALVGCWFWLNTKADNFETQILPQFVALLLVMHLAVSVAPYLNQRSVRDFWEYNRELFANLIVGAAFTLILFAGLALAMLAVDNLFNFRIPDRAYPKLFMVLAGVFNTAYFLFHFPKEYSHVSGLPALPAVALAEAGGPTSTIDTPTEPSFASASVKTTADKEASASKTDTTAYNWVFRNLCKYILIPIVLLYFVILYAYGAKIGLQWSLPKGWVSSLVIGFSVAGIFTYLLNFYLAEEDNSLIVRGFKRWFWWVLLPLTVLLFVAIGKRIGDYGVTEERFLVAQLGVWLAAACLYFLFSKNDNIKFIPISLALFALVWAFGPLSAFAVSERSQKGILTEILTRNGRFENGKMKPGSIPVTEPEREQVSSAILYLEKRKALSDLLPTPVDSTLLEYNGLLNWLKIGEHISNKTSTLNINPLISSEPLDVRGFDMAYKADLNSDNDKDGEAPGYFFRLSDDRKTLEWRQTKNGETTLVEVFSLSPAIQKWWLKKEKGDAYSYLTLPTGERTINLTGRHGSLCFIAQDVQIEEKGQEKRINYCNGWVLLKEK